MNILKFIKHILLLLLTFLLGAQTTYAKTELVLLQNAVVFSVEQTQSFRSLEKQVQPNVGFLSRKLSGKDRFVVSEGFSAQKLHFFSEGVVGVLANAVDDLFSNFTHLKNLPTDAKTFLSAKNWDNALLTKLDGDLATTTFKNAVDANPQLIDAWEIIRRNIDEFGTTTTKFALDEDVLNKVADLMQDGSSFRNAFGGNWQTKLDEIIKANKDLRCPTCLSVNGNPLGLTNVPPLNEVLENLEYICQYNVPGLETVVNSMKNSLSGARDGVNFMISAIKKNPNNYTGITAFEFRYADGIYNNTADVMMGSIKVEFKSWSPTNPQVWGKFFSGVQTNNFTSYTQFLRYLENSNSLNELKYIFNANKVGVATVENAFKDLFIAKAEDLFKPINQGGLGQAKMNQLFGVDNISDFLDEIDDISNPIYDFIKAE